MPTTFLSQLEELVLLAVQQLGEDAYGMSIAQAIKDATQKEPALAAVYTTLERMEHQGFVSSRQGDPSPTRGGRSKRYFRIEGAGVQALKEREWMLARMSGKVQTVGGTA